MDSQSVKNTDSAENKGYDSGKKVSGIKRHIAVDTQGLPHAIHVTTANVTDRAGALAMFDRRRANLSQVQNVLVDGGYTGKPFATAVQSLLGASVEVVKRNELHTFVQRQLLLPVPSIILAGSPPVSDCAAGPLRCGSWGRRIPG